MEIYSGGGCAVFGVMFLAAPIAPLLSSLPSLNRFKTTFFVNCLVLVLFKLGLMAVAKADLNLHCSNCLQVSFLLCTLKPKFENVIY